MRLFHNKRILVGITGSIAAYKAAELVRILRRYDAQVRVVMTKSACEFIMPLTLQALSGHPVHTEILDEKEEASMEHIMLARWADMVLIAPATANFIAHMSLGLGGDLLSVLCLATQAPVYIVPAMNRIMWLNTATQNNVARLKKRHMIFLGPGEGEQACGEFGVGRMLEPLTIVDMIEKTLQTKALSGKKVLITAGPTRENIDPVRYLSNRSSGKTGFALAEAAVEAGATVTLVTGPVNLVTPEHVKRFDVTSACEMDNVVMNVLDDDSYDLFIGSAAVSDYRPEKISTKKIKKNYSKKNETLTLNLVMNPDIIMRVSQRKKNRPYVVGFSAEIDHIIENTKNKMAYKKLDMVIANDVGQEHIGFESNDNSIMIFYKDQMREFSLLPKSLLARKIIHIIAEQLQPENSSSVNFLKTERKSSTII